MTNAMPGGTQVTPDPSTLGIPASFVFPPGTVFPGVERPVFSGSPLGVPPVDRIPGETPDSGTGSSAADYGQRTAGAPPHRQPIMWSIIMVVGGVLLLTHQARLNLRGG